MTFRSKGPVTRESSKFLSDNLVACRISTNSWSDDEMFYVSVEQFPLVEGRCFHVENSHANRGGFHLRLRTAPREGDYGFGHTSTLRLHTLLYQAQSVDVGLEVDHRVHWTYNYPEAVEFVTTEENVRAGAPILQTRRTRRKKVA